jgi:hypothetical protein
MPLRQLFSCTVNFTDDHVTAYVKGHLDTDTAQCLFAQLIPYAAAASGPRRSGRSGRLIFMGPRASLCWPDLKQSAVKNGGSIRLAEPVRPAHAVSGLQDGLPAVGAAKGIRATSHHRSPSALSGKNAAVTDTLARQPRSGDRTGRVGYELRERTASAVPMCQSVRCIGSDTLVSISTTTQRAAEAPPRNDYVSPDELLASATAHQTCRPKPVCAAPSARPIPLPAALTTLGAI